MAQLELPTAFIHRLLHGLRTGFAQQEPVEIDLAENFVGSDGLDQVILASHCNQQRQGEERLGGWQIERVDLLLNAGG